MFDDVHRALRGLHMLICILDIREDERETFATLSVHLITHISDLHGTLHLTCGDDSIQMFGGDFRRLKVENFIWRLLLTDLTARTRKPVFEHDNVHRVSLHEFVELLRHVARFTCGTRKSHTRHVHGMRVRPLTVLGLGLPHSSVTDRHGSAVTDRPSRNVHEDFIPFERPSQEHISLGHLPLWSQFRGDHTGGPGVELSVATDGGPGVELSGTTDVVHRDGVLSRSRRLLPLVSLAMADQEPEGSEEVRWQKLHEKWKADSDKMASPNQLICVREGVCLGPSQQGPAWFQVSQDCNNNPGAVETFIGAFQTEGDARRCHPHGGDACKYPLEDLARHEAWTNTWINTACGPAPGWYLGPDECWCHGAYVNA